MQFIGNTYLRDYNVGLSNLVSALLRPKSQPLRCTDETNCDGVLEWADGSPFVHDPALGLAGGMSIADNRDESCITYNPETDGLSATACQNTKLTVCIAEV